jgi:pyruvate/2-oxoglutarate/acetoin dehydrogenase E1 component
MRQIYIADAIREALSDALAEDPTVTVLGEDVELSTMGTTKGLVERFGPNRVRNTPISEASVLGACVGAAATGLRPVFDIMFSSFFYVCLDAIANQAARLRYMSGGQIQVPLTVIAPTGPSGSAAAHHSENPHAILMGLSGVKVAFPTTAADMKGLLLQSIRDPNPTVVFVDLMLLGKKGEVPDTTVGIPYGQADIKRAGTDVTVVAVGSAVGQSLQVAEELQSDGISVEVIDPRTLVPFDWDTVAASIKRTGRLVAVDPTRRTCGLSGEIVTRAVEMCWANLKAAPQRVTWPDVPMPYSPPLEKHVVIGNEDIRQAILSAVKS